MNKMFTIQTSPERKLKLCAIPTCQGKRYDLVHKFPMNNERAQQWIDAIDMPELNEMPLDKVRKRFFICSKHFRPQDYKNCESRSLNTTAYPRLHLKLGIDEEQNEQVLSNVENTTDELQVFEYITADGEAEVRQTDETDKTNTVPTAIKAATQTPVQYVVCSAANNVPILLRRNKNRHPEIIVEKSPQYNQSNTQTTIPVKKMISPIHNDSAGSHGIHIIENKTVLNKYVAKRKIAAVLEAPCKKIHLNGTDPLEMAEDITSGLYTFN